MCKLRNFTNLKKKQWIKIKSSVVQVIKLYKFEKKTVTQNKIFRCASYKTLQIWKKKTVNQNKVFPLCKLWNFTNLKKSPPNWYGHEWRNGYDTGLPISAECVPAFWRQKSSHTFEAYLCLGLIRVKYNINKLPRVRKEWYDIYLPQMGFHRWQQSVKLYKNRKETTVYIKRETIHKTIKNTEYTNIKETQKKYLKKQMSSN